MSRSTPDPEGSSSSVYGLSSVNINKNRVLPEQWTLPGEWNIEKREMFQNWKLDVQCQISTLSNMLDQSLSKYPQPDIGPFCGDPNVPNPELLVQQRRLNSGKMQIGLRRE